MVIFNERKFVDEMISTHTKEPKMSFRSFLKYLVKYYYPEYKEGSPKEYAKKILDAVNSFNFESYMYQEYEYYDYIYRLCRKAQKGEIKAELRNYDSIDITEAEMEIIAKGKDDNEQKLLFTLYVLAKVYSYHSGWVNYAPSEIFKLANIYMSWRNRFLLINSLYEAGLIELNHIIGKTGYKVELHEDSPAAVTVSVGKDFGKQYIAATRPGWGICQECGKLIRKKSPNQKYCKKCAEEVNRNKTAERMQKIRA